MAEASQITFSPKEIVEALVKKQNIHEGIWGLYVKFGIQAANVAFGAADLLPAAVIPVMEIGIQKFDEVNNLSVDASAVNPKNSKAVTQGKPESRSGRR